MTFDPYDFRGVGIPLDRPMRNTVEDAIENGRTVDRLIDAIERRDKAIAEIKTILSSYPGKNKTAVMRRIIGICPQCGGKRNPGKWACDSCLVKQRQKANDRHAKNSQLPPNISERYNNDNH